MISSPPFIIFRIFGSAIFASNCPFVQLFYLIHSYCGESFPQIDDLEMLNSSVFLLKSLSDIKNSSIKTQSKIAILYSYFFLKLLLFILENAFIFRRISKYFPEFSIFFSFFSFQ
jgi:hypothetical protein